MWKNDEYYYGVGTLKTIAENYDHIYDGIQYRPKLEREGATKGGEIITNSSIIIEYKVDFDRALNEIGRGNWTGYIEDNEFKDFRRFGRLQQVVIADICEIEDSHLEALGFYRIPNLKSIAYGRMVRFLNDGK